MEHCSQRITVRKDADKKTLISRLNRIEGQIRGVANMVQDDRYCDDIIIQLSAIDKSIKSLANLLLEKHMKSCVKERLNHGDETILEEIVDLFKRLQ
ncbi:MAG: metal-sensing transcriptional repressor [Anaeroplasmataceae bacterium]|nr:metal-sensing transcriptional repressor [Anaeroplasmataceae bacterium]